MRKLKSTLSRLNHRRKWRESARKTQKRVNLEASGTGAVPWWEVQEFLELFQPFQSEHELVRVGPEGDGGYLVPHDFDGLCAVFSPGVSDTLGFDQEMALMVGACYLADASVEPPENMAENMTFVQKYLGTKNEGNIITLESWVNSHTEPEDDLLLQIDIEGAEYDVLNITPDYVMQKFRHILIEYHHLDRVFDRTQFDKMSATVRKLADTHVLCHLHANNASPFYTFDGRQIPPLLEATYIRKDRVSSDLTPAQVPHALDQLNHPYFDDLPTPSFWQR